MDKKAILLIDDSQVLMDFTKKILERSDYTVECALGATRAREILRIIDPDAIIIGNSLFDGDGLELCSELRNETAAPIMFTSDVKEDELPALRAGASDFLRRPFDYEIFKARIGVMVLRKHEKSPEEHNESSIEPVKSARERANTGQIPLKMIQKDAETTVQSNVKYGPLPRRNLLIAAVISMLLTALLLTLLITMQPAKNYTDIPDGSIPLLETISPSESPEDTDSG